MVNRATDDRRIKKIKVDNEKRKFRRRKADVDNIKSYYFVLGLSVATFLFITVVSIIWGR